MQMCCRQVIKPSSRALSAALVSSNGEFRSVEDFFSQREFVFEAGKKRVTVHGSLYHRQIQFRAERQILLVNLRAPADEDRSAVVLKTQFLRVPNRADPGIRKPSLAEHNYFPARQRLADRFERFAPHQQD